jgi:hypothetical protein
MALTPEIPLKRLRVKKRPVRMNMIREAGTVVSSFLVSV